MQAVVMDSAAGIVINEPEGVNWDRVSDAPAVQG